MQISIKECPECLWELVSVHWQGASLRARRNGCADERRTEVCPPYEGLFRLSLRNGIIVLFRIYCSGARVHLDTRTKRK